MRESNRTPSNEIRMMYVPFDEYIYRKITDLCLDFVNSYKELDDDNGATVTKLENTFECLLDFAQNSNNLPEDMRNPPLEKWCLSPDNVHPRLALGWVMRLLNELKRQQDKSGRDRDQLVNKYLKSKKEDKLIVRSDMTPTMV